MLRSILSIATAITASITNGLVKFTGPSAGSIRTITIPDADAIMARTDATQSLTGNQTLTTGNLIIGTTGKGIDFSINSHTVGMTSELLNWYEEGTWTPAIAFGGGNTGITYSVQSGYYTKVGRIVTLTGGLTLTSKGSSIGAVTISGLPYPTKSGPPYITAGASGIISYTANLTTLTGIFLFVDHTSSSLQLFTGANAAFTDTNFANTTTLYGISITYQTN